MTQRTPGICELQWVAWEGLHYRGLTPDYKLKRIFIFNTDGKNKKIMYFKIIFENINYGHLQVLSSSTYNA